MKSCLKGIIIFLVFALTLSACTPNTSTTSPSTSVSTTLIATSTNSETYASMAGAGFLIYNNNCGSCHGIRGQGGEGPVLGITNLAKYKTAMGLFNFISSNMPQSSTEQLSHQDTLDILCYVLVQNSEVLGNTVFDENQLINITLK